MIMKWFVLIVIACVIGAVCALAFSRLRVQTHNIAAIFGDALVGLIVVVAVLVLGWLTFIRQP
jgi:hypothetical protein